jgi:ribonuclease-3
MDPAERAADAAARVAAVEERLGHRFRDRALLEQALRHSSGKSEALPSNERLEFLGDSVLGAIVAQHLYASQPGWDEGELTRVRSAVVSTASLAEASAALGIGPYVEVGKGMASQERLPMSLLADVFEAVVAAIYLDGGFAATERFVLATLAETIARTANEEVGKNWKSILQQYAQKHFAVTPTYRVVREVGPEHVKRFEVAALLGERGEMGRGEGRSKKEAEQRAAEDTLRRLLGARADEAREREPTAPPAIDVDVQIDETPVVWPERMRPPLGPPPEEPPPPPEAPEPPEPPPTDPPASA